MCAKCASRWYVEDFVAGKILRCIGPGCSEMVTLRSLFSTKEIAQRMKNMPDPKKNKMPLSLAKLRKKGEVQRCPGCGLVCQRTHGCDSMQCPKCSTYFDYATGKKRPY